MTYTTAIPRSASRAANPPHERRHSAKFARDAVIAAFGWRLAKALDQSDFHDRPPNAPPPWRSIGEASEDVLKKLAARIGRTAGQEFRAPAADSQQPTRN